MQQKYDRPVRSTCLPIEDVDAIRLSTMDGYARDGGEVGFGDGFVGQGGSLPADERRRSASDQVGGDQVAILPSVEG
jgi:hypothetical protein